MRNNDLDLDSITTLYKKGFDLGLAGDFGRLQSLIAKTAPNTINYIKSGWCEGRSFVRHQHKQLKFDVITNWITKNCDQNI